MPDTTSKPSGKRSNIHPRQGESAVVLLSGGQDSTTCLLLAIDLLGHDKIYPITFSYNQRHIVEINQARNICSFLKVRKPIVLTAEALDQLGGSSLTDDIAVGSSSGNVYAEAHGLPSSVVPGRNLLFLTLAAAYGAKLGCYNLITGGCFADFEGYPDCRPNFYRAAQWAIQFALDEPEVQVITPLTRVTKGETFAIADALHELSVITELTHTCYKGDRSLRHDWGAGCGECPACKTRAEGWNEYSLMTTAERTAVRTWIEDGTYFA